MLVELSYLISCFSGFLIIEHVGKCSKQAFLLLVDSEAVHISKQSASSSLNLLRKPRENGHPKTPKGLQFKYV